MATVTIDRTHNLGFETARKIALEWTQEGEEKFGLTCTQTKGDNEDVIAFERKGVKGQLVVNADYFKLEIKLGFLFSAYKDVMVKTINQNLDTLLAKYKK